MAGRGRGESMHLHQQDATDEHSERDRIYQQEAAQYFARQQRAGMPPNRSGFGSQGLHTIPASTTEVRNKQNNVKQIDIVANYVELQPIRNKIIQKYLVGFEPKVESLSTIRSLFRAAAKEVFEKVPIFDGVQECRTTQQMPQKTTTLKVVNERDDAKPEYCVSFTHTGTVEHGAESIRLYNMHMKEFLRLMGFHQPQTGVYVHERLATEINAELMMMRGFRTAANVLDGNKTMMNLEAAHKLMQRDNVLTIMSQIRKRTQATQLTSALHNELTGKLVVSSYDKRAYRIEEVRLDLTPMSTFECRGETMSYVEYYKRYKNVAIRETKQPLLLVVPNNQRRREEVTRETFLIPELCNIAGLTEPQRQDNKLKMDLIRASQVKPTDRVAQLRDFLKRFHTNDDIKTYLAQWGYSYAPNPVELKASVLAPTKIAFGDICRRSKAEYLPSNSETADVRVDGLAVSKAIKRMAFICCRNDLRDKSQIMNNIKSGFDQVRLAVNSVTQVDVQEGDRPADYIRAIKNLPQDTECAIVIMNRQNKERYDAIKKAASVERGLITQVVTARLMTDQRKARSAATKIAIQIAAKVGGEPWWTDIPLKDAMVCGYDTYHDTANRGRSYGAFVASMNEAYSRWWSKADSHDRLEEISAQVAANLVEAIKQYRAFNDDKFPQRVFIYRDGVGEGQLAHVYEVELKRLIEVLQDIGAPGKIALTMIIVNKRIGARFYMRADRTGDFLNPPPGTIIDHTVTRQERFDFYLVSQSTRQGTIMPTYYNIIHDDVGFSPEIHQKLAFKLCLLYYNWTGTVRVPAPCQYAHKLALLCGEHLHAQPHAAMDDRLHYL